MDSSDSRVQPVEGKNRQPLLLRPKVSYPTFQLFARVASKKTTPEDAFNIAVLETMAWLRQRFRAQEIPAAMQLPEAADYLELAPDALKSFRIDEGYVVEVVHLAEQGIWALHLSEPDLGPEPERVDQPRLPVPGRMFETNIAFRRSVNEVQCAFKTICSEPTGTDAVCEVFRLAVVKTLVRNPYLGLTQTLPIVEKAITIENDRDLTRLRDSLKDPARQLPVVILSHRPPGDRKAANLQAERRHLEELTDPVASLTARRQPLDLWRGPTDTASPMAVADPDALARHLVGFAHVVVLPLREAAFYIRKLGSQNTPLQGDGRVIFPVSSGQPPRTIIYPETAEQRRALLLSLMNELSSYPKGRQMSFGDVKFLLDARILEHHLRALQSTSTGEALAGKEAEIAAILQSHAAERLELQSKIDHQQRKLDQRKQLELTHAEALTAERANTARVEQLLALSQNELAEKQVSINNLRQDLASLTDCEAFIRWVDAEHGERLFLTPRARQMLKKANFTETLLLYDTFNLLAFQYRDMILNSEADPALREDYEKERLRLNLDWSGLETPSLYDGMQGHFRGGGHTEQKMLRVYFNWDAEIRRVIIGGIPTHWPDGSK